MAKQTGLDPAALVEAFKAKHCSEGSMVIDAWFQEGTLFVYVDGEQTTDETGVPTDAFLDLSDPEGFEGVPIQVTLFPKPMS